MDWRGNLFHLSSNYIALHSLKHIVLLTTKAVGREDELVNILAYCVAMLWVIPGSKVANMWTGEVKSLMYHSMS